MEIKLILLIYLLDYITILVVLDILNTSFHLLNIRKSSFYKIQPFTFIPVLTEVAFFPLLVIGKINQQQTIIMSRSKIGLHKQNIKIYHAE